MFVARGASFVFLFSLFSNFTLCKKSFFGREGIVVDPGPGEFFHLCGWEVCPSVYSYRYSTTTCTGSAAVVRTPEIAANAPNIHTVFSNPPPHSIARVQGIFVPIVNVLNPLRHF